MSYPLGRRPAPPTQLRHGIELARASGASFDVAWDGAWKAVIWPHDTIHRRQWKTALRATRPEWEACWDGLFTPTSKLLRDLEPMITLVADGDEQREVLVA